MSSDRETRYGIEHATQDRKQSRRQVKMPGKAGYETTADGAERIARKIQIDKVERRARRRA